MSIPTINPHDVRGMPYKVAVLCYLYDPQGRLLLLHRRKPPNRDMYSPIGGKLEVAQGEGPHECALREIREEACVALKPEEIKRIEVKLRRGDPVVLELEGEVKRLRDRLAEYHREKASTALVVWRPKRAK